MKEVPQRHLPEISGGNPWEPGIPPTNPGTDQPYPRNPYGPIVELPDSTQE